jgi:hypothetical protein
MPNNYVIEQSRSIIVMSVVTAMFVPGPGIMALEFPRWFTKHPMTAIQSVSEDTVNSK